MFCYTNAASNVIRNKSDDALEGERAFDSLFYNNEYRENNSIPDCCPTDPQAEILLQGTIPPEMIKEVWFDSYSSFIINKGYNKYVPAAKFQVNYMLFGNLKYSNLVKKEGA